MRLSGHFITLLCKMIFEQDLPCMSQEVMHAFLNILYWYATPNGTFIRMFGIEKPLYELRRFSIDKLVMQEVAYNISTQCSTTLYSWKKAPWPTLVLQIGLYKICTMKYVDVQTGNLKKFRFETKSFNSYDPHCICKNKCVKMYFAWFHGVCHWPKEDPWQYLYNSYRLNEPNNMPIERKMELHAAAPQEATTATTVSSKPPQEKIKRNITESAEVEQI